MTKISIQKYLQKNTDSAPLAVFRIFFGLLMFISLLRFWSKGWIEDLYIKPKFFFSFYGFEWVKPIGEYTYLLFIICIIASICITIGYKYRLAIISFFLCFTYIELMDKTHYLNHYYFVCIISFLLTLLPANAYFSLDAKLDKKKAFQEIPRWTIDSIKLMLCIVYFYAGLAKLNSDWLLRASPLNIWLPIRNTIPIIGEFMPKTWFHFAMSWSGAIYDLTIPFLLIFKRTRKIGFILVVVFHIFTRILFSIGMFPYIMIVATIIFFDKKVHHKILEVISSLFKISKECFDTNKAYISSRTQKITIIALAIFFTIQLLFPFRYLLYPGELFWTEEGYRFSWRVMLIEKAGYAEFKVIDKETKQHIYIDNQDYLTKIQEKQMSFQPDFILEYAHYLGDTFKKKGMKSPQVFVDSHVTLNGRLSTRFIEPTIDLYQQKDSFKHKNWIIPFNHEIKIKGL
ncbi:Deoxyribonuclease HsdR [Tenacibaculum sp. 190524A02b]|uniref:HTTM domain-containing protein n=1 Tax=Tenacibaculum vairaonense TaxID=3137860 RepID=UPI0032B1992E